MAGEGFLSPPRRFHSPVPGFSPGFNIHAQTPRGELRPWIGSKWGCRAAPLGHTTHSRSVAGWELRVASPCRSSGPSPVGASRCWMLWRHPGSGGIQGSPACAVLVELDPALKAAGLSWAGLGSGDRARAELWLLLLSHTPGKAEPLQQEVREEVPDRGGALQGAPAHRLLPQDGDEAGHRAGGERRHWQDPLCRLHCLHPVSSQPWAPSHGTLSWWPQGKQPLGAAWPSWRGSESCLSTQEHQPQDPPPGARPSSPVQGQGGGDPENPSQ